MVQGCGQITRAARGWVDLGSTNGNFNLFYRGRGVVVVFHSASASAVFSTTQRTGLAPR